MGIDSPYALVGLLVLPIIFVVIIRGARRQQEIRKALHEDYSGVRKDALFKLTLSCIAVASLIMIMAQPYFFDAVPQKGKNGQYLFAVDVSTSMAAREELNSSSQLDRSKKIIQETISGVPEACFGMMIFSKLAFPVSSITCDRGILEEVVSREIAVDRIPERGSDVINALRIAARRISSSELYKGVTHVIVLTDGGSGQFADTADKIISEFKDQHLQFIIIGVGAKNGASIPLFDEMGNFTGSYAMSDGQEYFAFLQGEWLHSLALRIDGVYLEQTQGSELISILRYALKDTNSQPDDIIEKRDLGWIFFIPLNIAFLVLLWRRDL